MIANACSRCGKQRIISRTWNESIDTLRGKVTISYSDSKCPDNECQKIVDSELLVEEQKRIKLRDDKEKKKQKRIEEAAALLSK
jgi:hypothetical protein